ncbi:hypothetical protein H696_03109 [Fonticula alba]|uniref:Uncharacterized protein n=1 Tax=Fonticula alba TaxID=691883 RepID=A0A058Z9Z5_FONAL|nr:hypothetical protein H696_03109 [Fonticula alba]KCV70758.1 hypothetical protein H696_03109 [Fonticula alba]|eukprot:XP_009495274.1 hypothetical protein H696_03109 [Fonticula alba]
MLSLNMRLGALGTASRRLFASKVTQAGPPKTLIPGCRVSLIPPTHPDSRPFLVATVTPRLDTAQLEANFHIPACDHVAFRAKDVHFPRESIDFLCRMALPASSLNLAGWYLTPQLLSVLVSPKTSFLTIESPKVFLPQDEVMDKYLSFEPHNVHSLTLKKVHLTYFASFFFANFFRATQATNGLSLSLIDCPIDHDGLNLRDLLMDLPIRHLEIDSPSRLNINRLFAILSTITTLESISINGIHGFSIQENVLDECKQLRLLDLRGRSAPSFKDYRDLITMAESRSFQVLLPSPSRFGNIFPGPVVHASSSGEAPFGYNKFGSLAFQQLVADRDIQHCRVSSHLARSTTELNHYFHALGLGALQTVISPLYEYLCETALTTDTPPGASAPFDQVRKALFAGPPLPLKEALSELLRQQPGLLSSSAQERVFFALSPEKWSVSDLRHPLPVEVAGRLIYLNHLDALLTLALYDHAICRALATGQAHHVSGFEVELFAILRGLAPNDPRQDLSSLLAAVLDHVHAEVPLMSFFPSGTQLATLSPLDLCDRFNMYNSQALLLAAHLRRLVEPSLPPPEPTSFLCINRVDINDWFDMASQLSTEPFTSVSPVPPPLRQASSTLFSAHGTSAQRLATLPCPSAADFLDLASGFGLLGLLKMEQFFHNLGPFEGSPLRQAISQHISATAPGKFHLPSGTRNQLNLTENLPTPHLTFVQWRLNSLLTHGQTLLNWSIASGAVPMWLAQLRLDMPLLPASVPPTAAAMALAPLRHPRQLHILPGPDSTHSSADDPDSWEFITH